MRKNLFALTSQGEKLSFAFPSSLRHLFFDIILVMMVVAGITFNHLAIRNSNSGVYNTVGALAIFKESISNKVADLKCFILGIEQRKILGLHIYIARYSTIQSKVSCLIFGKNSIRMAPFFDDLD